VHTVIAGLGGRSITRGSLHRVFEQALTDSLDHLTFLDLDRALVDRVLERERLQRRSGPIAEGILKDLGVVAAKIG
jgi:pyruvate ferredoxin oxidoreductase alpha subunit